MKKQQLVLYFLILVVIVIATSNNIKTTNIYSPIGQGKDFEKLNLEKNKGFYNETSKIQTKGSINSYLIDNKIKPAAIKQQYYRLNNIKAEYRQMLYNTSNKLPKGIVVHATAGGENDNIYNEITYMNNNWYNAFVHAFSDFEQTIETHNPQYAAWGAGANANPYYIHVELVETGSKDKFMKSINNQAYYTAYKLRQFNLSPSRAKKDKSGSLWFHSEVTQYLGGTDHSDPTGYFKKHGYSLAEFYDLVVYHYNKIENPWQVETSITKYSNNTIKNKTIIKKYYGRIVEKYVYNYFDNGLRSLYQVNTYHTNAKIKSQVSYIYKKKTSKTIYLSNKIDTVWNTNSLMTSKSFSNYKNNGAILLKRTYTYHSNSKYKQLIRVAYQERKVKINNRYFLKNYRTSLSNEKYSSNGLRTSTLKYYYNYRGQLKTNGYGSGKRLQYYYKNGKLKQRNLKYYTKYGSLSRKTYIKKY